MFRVRLLGGATLEGPDGPIAGRAAHRRRIALLALLAAAGDRTVGRERLIGHLWPEHPQAAARHLLSESLYVLRKTLGEDAFVVAGDEVGLNDEVVGSDVAEFHAALVEDAPERAVAVYGGPFLDGFYVDDAPDFERWVDEERDRLARAYADALETLAEAREAADDPRGAARWWRRLAAHDPFSSRVALRLMRALEAAGDSAAALRHAAAHADLMRRELEVDPDPEVAEFVERLQDERAAGTDKALTAIPRSPAAGPVDWGADGGAEPEEPVVLEEPADETARSAGEGAAEDPVPDAGADGRSSMHVSAEGGFEAGGAAAPPVRRSRWGVAAGAVALVAAVLAGWIVVRRADADREPEIDPRRIAVLYFENLSSDSALGPIADGLTETVTARLSLIDGLRVVSRTDVKRFREGAASIDSIGRTLGVAYVVESSIQGARDRIRATAQLIDVQTGNHLTTVQVESDRSDPLLLGSEVTDSILLALRPRLGQAIELRERRRGTSDEEAWRLVQRADSLIGRAAPGFGTNASLDSTVAFEMLREADSLLAEAVRRDPEWTEPELRRGSGAIAAGRRLGVGGAPHFRRAVRHANEVLRRRPRDAAALELRGVARWLRVHIAGGLPEAAADSISALAEADLTRAVAADPDRARAWAYLSQLLRLHRGEFAEAYAAAAKALDSDPMLVEAPQVTETLYRAALGLTRYDDAGRWCEYGRIRFPADSRFVECELTLMGQEGALPADPDRAWELHRQLRQMEPPGTAATAGRSYHPFYRDMAVAKVLARAGLADSALAIIQRTADQVRGDPELESSWSYDAGVVYCILEDRTEAARLLEGYLRAHPEYGEFIRREPWLGSCLPTL